MPLSFPVLQKDVTKVVRPEHLVPWVPRASWDGWFAIAIFPPASPVRWLKAHLFHRACRPGWHPLAAVEALDENSETLVTWATTDSFEVYQEELESPDIRWSAFPLEVMLEGRFLLRGRTPSYTMTFNLPDAATEARFSFEAGWPIWWSRWGRLLTYAGQHSTVRVELSCHGAQREMEGFGVMEHVCGISLPFDFTRFLPFHYHWDVLAFHQESAPHSSAAGLSIGRMGETLLKLRSVASLPGHPREAASGLTVRLLETGRGRGSDGTDFLVPRRWEGTVRGRGSEFTYEAHASTPVADIIPGGGMLGFDFQGEWHSPGIGIESWGGTGFTEYGDFSGELVSLAESSM